MATLQALPSSATKLPQESVRTGTAGVALEQMEASRPRPFGEGDPLAFGGPVARLPVELDVAVPVREFRVRHLLILEPGQVIETQWAQGEDMPLASGQVQLAWSEFEVVDMQLAVRITRLS